MTQEEKAKAYDEAIERSKNYYSTTDSSADIKLIGLIFPELKESEDERIRKALIQIFNVENFENYDIKNEEVIAWLEKQGEQHPADKVEPKFKVGDFIANDYCRGNVVALTNDAYLLDTGQGIPFSCEHNIHLWTIQDAEAGDVLVASDDSIFLFKCTIDCACKHYVALTTDGAVKLNEGLEHFWETSTAVHPATKEQRDLLFSKMKDAGYEWNADKKELKKIEQKPWSEEDERNLDWLITVCGRIYYKSDPQVSSEGALMLEDWLKSLKDRVQPQLKQEWSEEEERLRKEIVNYLECQKEEEPTRKEKINSWISWILKHSFSEWTKEEKEAWNKRLDCIIDILDWAEEKGRISLSDCQDYSIMLKSLIPQNTWQPNDGQMTALNYVINLMASSKSAFENDYCYNVFKDLREQLKKLREE